MAGKRRLIDDEWDRARGIETWHTYDHHTNETTIEVVQDAAPFLEAAQKLRNKGDTGGGSRLTSKDKTQIQRGWWHAAILPIGVQYKWLKEHGVDAGNPDHTEGVKRLLNSPDYQYLKTTRGKI